MGVKQVALDAAGRVGRFVPVRSVQLFSFVASPAVRADPWKLYRRLHAEGGVLDTKYGVTVVASHAVATGLLRSADVSVDESNAVGLDGMHDDPDSPFEKLVGESLLFTDPPDHARLRRLVSRAFTPRTIERMRPRVEDMVDELVAGLRPAGRADVIDAVALPLPVAVISELLGVPEEERPRLQACARAVAPRLDLSVFRDLEKERRGDEAATELGRLFGELLDDPGRRDPEGLLSALVAVEEEGDRLTRAELISLCALLLAAGFETTMNLIGNGLLALLRNPSQLARVREGSVPPDRLVDELLRFDGPVQMTQRVPMVDLSIEGHDLAARRLVLVLVGAANHDPAVFSQPDRLDVGRDPNPHLAFSSGIHHCLGAALARLEAGVVLPALVRSLPNLRLAAKPRYRDTFVLRGLRALPVEWSMIAAA